jgi:hypothetical protein
MRSILSLCVCVCVFWWVGGCVHVCIFVAVTCIFGKVNTVV